MPDLNMPIGAGHFPVVVLTCETVSAARRPVLDRVNKVPGILVNLAGFVTFSTNKHHSKKQNS